MCRHDRLLWWCIVPMICVYAVEYHLPHRVAAQFGRAQRTPPGGRIDTGGSDLHLMSRQKNQSIIDWGETHDIYVWEWNDWKTRKVVERKVIDWDAYEDHMRWYDDGIKHRLRLGPQWTTADAEALYDDDSENEAYHDNIRELEGGFREYAPLMNKMSSELNKSIFDGSDVLSSIPGSRDSEKKLRGIVKKFVKNCRKLVGLLGCASSADAYAPAAPMRSLASSSHAASSSRVVEEDEEEEGEDEEDDEERAEEEHEEEEERSDEEEYNDDDGPPPTQTTLLEKRNVPKRDWASPSPFQKPRHCARKKEG